MLDPNALIYIPYPRVNCLKTIPFTAANTYIAHIWQYPPGQNGAKTQPFGAAHTNGLYKGLSPGDTVYQIGVACLFRYGFINSELHKILLHEGFRLACVASVSWRGSSRKLGQEQKKMNDGGGGGE